MSSDRGSSQGTKETLGVPQLAQGASVCNLSQWESWATPLGASGDGSL